MKYRPEGSAVNPFLSFTAVFFRPFPVLFSRHRPASEQYKSTRYLRILDNERYTSPCLLEVLLCFLAVSCLSCSPNNVGVGFAIWSDVHKFHFFDDDRYLFCFVLMTEQVDQEVEVFDGVISAVEKRLDIGVNPFINLSMVIFLCSSKAYIVDGFGLNCFLLS